MKFDESANLLFFRLSFLLKSVNVQPLYQMSGKGKLKPPVVAAVVVVGVAEAV